MPCVVCGCGRSLNQVDEVRGAIVIGVNDVGRRTCPDYLVVVDDEHSMAGERWWFVAHSRAKYVFAPFELHLRHSIAVRLVLGEYGGTAIERESGIPITQNSPYVAVCLAAYMGASRIGLLGVDFRDDHFYGPTGRHPLTQHVQMIDQQYRALCRALEYRDTELINLSLDSALVSLPKCSIATFCDTASGVGPHTDPDDIAPYQG